eukprot:1500369-Pyramimonas_sp.AAC.1
MPFRPRQSATAPLGAAAGWRGRNAYSFKHPWGVHEGPWPHNAKRYWACRVPPGVPRSVSRDFVGPGGMPDMGREGIARPSRRPWKNP